MMEALKQENIRVPGNSDRKVARIRNTGDELRERVTRAALCNTSHVI